jgi:hypothetical protein
VDISSARAELTAYSVSHLQALQVPAGTTYIFAGAGAGPGNTATNVDVALVGPGGDLLQPGTTTDGWTATSSLSPPRSGYAGIAGAGILFTFGGPQSAPGDTLHGASIGATPPLLSNWNSESVHLTVERYLSGSALESAFIYVVGGDTPSGATASVERTVL